MYVCVRAYVCIYNFYCSIIRDFNIHFKFFKLYNINFGLKTILKLNQK